MVRLGSRLIKSTIQEQPRGKQRPGNFAPACRSGLRIECTLDAPTQLVETLAEAERLLPIAFVGDDGLGSALVQLLSQFGAVVGFVAEHAFRGLGSADQALGYRAIVRFTAGH